MRAFIVRPFGTKPAHEKPGLTIDFDRVERELIAPALAAIGVEGRTTAEIVQQGNIREDMFQRLVTADLVVADLSIHNANVFYELGIRHALRRRRTLLLRASVDSYPFDLQTDRYLTYDANAPSASLEALKASLSATLASGATDSPVFRLLPNLQQQERSHLVEVPRDFSEELVRALAKGQRGDTALLAEEVRGLPWESEGLRQIGRAQFELRASRDAVRTWEALRALDPDDIEANQKLATLYQRLKAIDRSDECIRRVLARSDTPARDRAEAHALLASNAKTRWREEWEGKPDASERALRSGWLRDATQHYFEGFCEDLDHYYSGANALAMFTLQAGLAKEHPALFEARFDSPEDAACELRAIESRSAELRGAVALALHAAARREPASSWVKITIADLELLTEDRLERVEVAYREALAGASSFTCEALRRQLELFTGLGVRTAQAQAAKLALPPQLEPEPSVSRVLQFTGHMVDAEGRSPARFPRTFEAIEQARAAIAARIAAECEPGQRTLGIAGGACGGDLLFHEECSKHDIDTRMFLALPRDQFIRESVQRGGDTWVELFNDQFDRLSAAGRVHVLVDDPEQARSKALPHWLYDRQGYSIWDRANLWMLSHAYAFAERVTLIALWDGAAGDGPGGTADLWRRGLARGAKPVRLDTKKVFA